MVPRLPLFVGLVALVAAAGCFAWEEDARSVDNEVVQGGDLSEVLKSTVILDSGCVATKVGPRHLLVAARCVAGKDAYASGKTITFDVASASNGLVAGDPADTVDAPKRSTDAGSDETADAGAPSDAGAAEPPRRGSREAVISEVVVHASYSAKCEGSRCGFGSLEASDARDIAVVVLEEELEDLPTVPVDLDTVGQSDPLVALGSGCSQIDGTPRRLEAFETIAVPARTANHAGSPYLQRPELVSRLGASYVVAPGIGWRASAPRLCKRDIGAPLFRADVAAVAGVTSSFTTFEERSLVPVTVHYTRVDTKSKVGAWLKSLGVETTRSCSDTEAGCVKRGYDGGVPTPVQTDGTTGPGDGGADPIAPGDGGAEEEEADTAPPSTDLPSEGVEEPLPPTYDDDDDGPRESADIEYDASPRKKKKKAQSGCSAAPGTTPSGGALLGVGLALAAAAARRRRSPAG